jgi:CRISPR-associated protein Csx3
LEIKDMELFPAVMIGGPPHSGKSVLAYSLTQALRARGVAHYVLRAYPDGEGDWANEADQALVRRIRVKGEGTPQWIARMCQDIANRHLPLIVDVGGRPTSDQEAVFDYCTHAILLTPDEEARSCWRKLASRHGLPLLADLHSTLTGEDLVHATAPFLRGQISRLERGRTARGPAFQALLDRLVALFAYDAAELRTAHLSLAPVELVVELARMGRTLGLGDEWRRWSPRDLPALLDYLPAQKPLAVYDRGPNWLYAALALYAYPEPLYQFDVRLGWVAPPTLLIDPASPSSLLAARLLDRPTHTRLELALAGDYLDYGEAGGLALPPLPPGKGVVLSGKLPLWLWTALVRAYRDAPWLAVFQPPLGHRAVVVASQDQAMPIGALVISEP